MGTTRTCATCGENIVGILDRCPKDGTPLFSEEIMSRVGMLLKDHELLGVIGEGGMGVVYRAQHVVIDKPVAIKVLHDRFARRTDMVDQFIVEAKAASRIRHPNIIDVTDFGTTPEGLVFQVMEYLDGESLEDRLDKVDRLPVFPSINIIKQVARGLGAAHELGIVHRDLKPANIFLCVREGRRRVVQRMQEGTAARFAVEPEQTFDFVKLLDFGVAKFMDLGPSAATRSGSVCGTPHYLSPEQAQEKPASERSDIYALGIMFYEMITGDVPFSGNSMLEILNGHVTKPVIPPSRVAPEAGIDARVDAVILKCLEKNPAHRFASTDELCEALGECVTDRAYLRDAHKLPGFAESGIAVPEAPAGLAVTPPPARPTKEKGFSAVGDDDVVPDLGGRADREDPPVSRETQEIFRPSHNRSGLWVTLGLLLVGGAATGVYFLRSTDHGSMPAPVGKPALSPIPTPPPRVEIPVDAQPGVAAPMPAPTPASTPPVTAPALAFAPVAKPGKVPSELPAAARTHVVPVGPRPKLPAGFVVPPEEGAPAPKPVEAKPLEVKPAEPKVVEAKPTDSSDVEVEALLKEAQQAWLKQYYAVAIDKAQAVLRADPKRYNAYQIIAVSSCAMGDTDAARKAAAHLDDHKRQQVIALCKRQGVDLE